MRVSAVICEFNPFHNGHKYLIDSMKDSGLTDFCVCIMSGNFVQRGEPAIFDKFSRTRMALLSGADLVIELPLIFACASAGEFGMAGVNTALKTGIIDSLFFGTEGNISFEKLKEISVSLSIYEDNPDFKHLIRSGLNYPEALSAMYGSEFLPQFTLSNNILAIEYLRALHKSDKKERIRAFPVPLIKTMSAGTIRKILSEKNSSGLGLIKDYVPPSSWPVYTSLVENKLYVARDTSINQGVCIAKTQMENKPDPLSDYLRLRLLEAKYGRGRPLTEYLDVRTEIANRLLELADLSLSVDEIISKVKSREYTYGRISRVIMHIVLDITKEEFEKRKEKGYVSAIRILGFRNEAAKKGLLKELKKGASASIVTKPAANADFINEDLFREQLYYSLIPGLSIKSEYKHSPVIV